MNQQELKSYFSKKNRTDLMLIICSFSIYLIYFHNIIFHFNGILSSITLDSLKNYYTYVYHIKNDAHALSFSGLNYPYGEHVVYTDCQPILTFLLRALPFTHNYLIGILHALMFFSFILSPLVLIRIFRLLQIDELFSFLISIGICLLAPQFLKINAGHFALAYGLIFPLVILFLLRYTFEKSRKHFWILFLYNSLLFLLHPYLGFCCSLFCFLSLGILEIISFNKTTILRNLVSLITLSLAPILVFKIFMVATDHHTDRTTEPYGTEVMIENIDSMVSPVFGPFKSLMETFFSNRTQHFEGHSYLGFFTIVLSVVFIILFPFIRKKIEVKKEIVALFLAAFIILLISFGVHLKIFELFRIKSASMNQFRAVCRFAWLFYYVLPLLVIPSLYHYFKKISTDKIFRNSSMFIAFLFLFLNLYEAHYFFKLDESSYWKFRNIFDTKYLNAEEKENLKKIAENKPQAILPLPIYHGGSEMYDRFGSSNSMVPSMIYSYHSGLPILSVMLSRTSLTETENLIQVLNSYKKKKVITKDFTDRGFFVINTNDQKLPDEERLLANIQLSKANDSLSFGFITKSQLLSPKYSKTRIDLKQTNLQAADSNGIVFIEKESRKPFTESNIKDYEKILLLDSNQIKSGKYIVSLHFYYEKRTYQALAVGLIVNRLNATGSEWEYNIPVRNLSGFYPGYGVFEYTIDLKKENRYEFLLKGDLDVTYKISHFLLRPKDTDTRLTTSSRDTIYNNFPY